MSLFVTADLGIISLGFFEIHFATFECVFVTFICDSADDDPDLFDRYDNTLCSLLDVHTPTRTVGVRADRSAPWYDTDCPEAKKMRRLEKLYRTSKAAGDGLQWTAETGYQRQFFQR